MSIVEHPVVHDPLSDAPPEDSVANSVAASVQAKGAPAATYDVPQIEPVPDDEAGPAVSSWQQAEALATWHMQKLGFDDANMTPPGADGGLDVRATVTPYRLDDADRALMDLERDAVRGAAVLTMD